MKSEGKQLDRPIAVKHVEMKLPGEMRVSEKYDYQLPVR